MDGNHLPPGQGPQPAASGPATGSHGPAPPAEAAAAVLELSALMDAQLALRLAAFREGWQAAWQARASDYHRGYIDGLLRRKHAEHEAADALRLYLRRWELRGERRTRAT